jgi:hypothetical protein
MVILFLFRKSMSMSHKGKQYEQKDVLIVVKLKTSLFSTKTHNKKTDTVVIVKSALLIEIKINILNQAKTMSGN